MNPFEITSLKTIIGLLFLVFLSSCAKDEVEVETVCNSNRYVDSIFTEYIVTTVQYGSNINTLGTQQNLMVDVYEPKGDTLSKRPVIILAFGGSFILGDRKQLSEFAIELSKMGFVAACIDYRLLSLTQWPIDSIKGLDIAIKASTDMKAAIRYFRKDAATVNAFKIDPNHIIIGGVSAGSIAAIQAAYFDETDNVDANVKQAIAANGGIEGNSGDAENLKYSSKVQGVIDMSGAIYRTQYIDAGEPPIVSIHGDADTTVPYGYGFAAPLGIKILPLYGSFEINKRAKEVGINTSLTTVVGGGHEDIYSEAAFANDFIKFKTAAYSFTKEIICQ